MDSNKRTMKEKQLEEICDVCGECLDEENASHCSLCGRKFHMAWSIQADVKACGRIWVNDMHCGIGFVCDICLTEYPELSHSIIEVGQEMPPC